MHGSDGPVDVSAACPVLQDWDLHENLDSKGALLFRRFATRAARRGAVAGPPAIWRTPFDAADPVNTPRGLNTDEPARRARRSPTRSTTCTGSAIPLDAPLREVQFETRGGEKIPIHGGPGDPGDFNAINVAVRAGRGLPERAARLELRDGRAPGRRRVPGRCARS